MSEWEVINFDNRLDDMVEYHFGVDVQILTDPITGEISMGWARPGSKMSQLWRKDAEYGKEDY